MSGCLAVSVFLSIRVGTHPPGHVCSRYPLGRSVLVSGTLASAIRIKLDPHLRGKVGAGQAERRKCMATTLSRTKQAPVSIAKMNRDDLKAYTDRIAEFAAGDGIVAIRICECCVLIKD